MTQRDRNGITQRDKSCPDAVHQGRDNSFRSYPVPMQPDGRDTTAQGRIGITSLPGLSEGRFRAVGDSLHPDLPGALPATLAFNLCDPTQQRTER